MSTEPAPTKPLGRRYLLYDQLGSGNMGTVYRTYDRLSGQMVALKQVKLAAEELDYGSRQSNMSASVTLAQEFRILSSLRHPNIISVLDYGFHQSSETASRQPYITMELLENASSFLDYAETRPREEQMKLLLQILQALMYLHRRNVLHRDLKPKNVLVVDGQVKVLDFGLSVQTEQAKAGEVAGTPSYMAPELWVGQPATRRSDLYAVGVMAYRLFAGQHPFDTSSLKKLFHEVRNNTADLTRMDVSDAVREVIGRLLAKDPAERLDDAFEVIQLLRRATGQVLAVETAATRESFLQAATFVGRERELYLLSEVLSRALDGEGSAWLVAGESGVGKSRLLDEMRTRALVQGALVLRGQAVSESSPPYYLWRGALRWLALLSDVDDRQASVLKTLVPDIAKLLGREVADPSEVTPQAAQTRLLRVLEQLFGSAMKPAGSDLQPLVLILEDLHWADAESLTALARLVQIARDFPLLIIGSYRDDESPDLPMLLPGMKVMRLERLTSDQTAQLAEAMLGAPGRNQDLLALLQQETEGNTFFLVELVRALAEESGHLAAVGTRQLPMSVLTGGMQGIIQRRLNRVPEQARGFLRLAAVVGRQLDMDVIGEVLERTGKRGQLEGWLTDCADAAVLEFSDGVWRFSHNKLREGVIAAIPEDSARELYRRVAEAHEAVTQYSIKQNAETLMYRWGLVGDPVKEEHYAALAGEQALRNGAYQAAQAFLERVLHLQETIDVPPRKRASVRQQLGDAYMELGQVEQASRLYRESHDLYQQADYRWGVSAALTRIGNVASAEGRFQDGARDLIQALRIAVEARAQTQAVASLVAMAGLLARTGRREVALEYVTLAVNHPAIDGQTHYVAERLLNTLRRELPAEAIERATERGKRLELKEVAARILQ
ncbi:serine/threonine-protein kinase PknK [Anaerolineae bacterium CFX9]|nr:serine/threonine-protein kinase PknK [Anaerolineae bacterium CFX9]